MTDLPEIEDSNETMGTLSSAETKNTGIMIPKSRFDEVNEKYKAAADKLMALQNEHQQKEQQALVEQNRFKELYEQVKAQLEMLRQVQETAERYRGSLQATNESRVAQIPESKRHLVPAFEDPIALSAWLDRALPDLIVPAKPAAPSLDGSAGTLDGKQEQGVVISATHDALADIAAQHGYKVSKERIATYAKNAARNIRTGDET